ncbi:MAG: hypothetical protein J6B98_01095 [Bacilli bacterium]|nr:hypothetical protein [Bacilli bacterium]
MKKNEIYKIGSMILVFLITFMMFNPVVFADGFDFCTKSGVVKTFQILGWCLLIIKIVVPILLIVMGSIDFGKAVISSDDNAIKGAISILIKRAIAAVVVFFIPTIISAAFGLVKGAEELSGYNCLSECIADPANCKIPAGGVFGE